MSTGERDQTTLLRTAPHYQILETTPYAADLSCPVLWCTTLMTAFYFNVATTAGIPSNKKNPIFHYQWIMQRSCLMQNWGQNNQIPSCRKLKTHLQEISLRLQLSGNVIQLESFVCGGRKELIFKKGASGVSPTDTRGSLSNYLLYQIAFSKLQLPNGTTADICGSNGVQNPIHSIYSQSLTFTVQCQNTYLILQRTAMKKQQLWGKNHLG